MADLDYYIWKEIDEDTKLPRLCWEVVEIDEGPDGDDRAIASGFARDNDDARLKISVAMQQHKSK